MDFKWTLSRPGIALEFETGSIKEAIGMLEQEGSQINEIFGFTVGAHQEAKSSATEATGETSAPEATGKKRGRPAKAAVEAVAPDPMPVPASAPPELPPAPIAAPPAPPAPAPELAIPADGGIPPFLQRTAAPPITPPLPVAPPPVGMLGPRVVAALEKLREGKPDGGQALADWLAGAGLTIKGADFDAACRVVLMTSDEKLKGVADALKA